MKPFRLLVLLLVAAFLWSGVRESSVVSRLRTEQEVLVSRARSIGLPENENYEERSHSRAPGRPSTSKIPAERLKDEMVAAYHRLKALEDSEDSENRLRVEAEVREWIGRLIDLSPKELKRMIADLTSDSSLDPKEVRDLVSVALNLAASRQGETAAELALAHRKLGASVTVVMGGWAQQDPSNAFAWLEKNREFLGRDYDTSLQQAIKQGASRDPALALANLPKIDHEVARANSAKWVGAAMLDDEARSALLSDLRQLDNVDINRSAILEGIGRGMIQHSAAGPGSWMKDLSPDEALSVANGISSNPNFTPSPDAWLGWMGKSLPPEKVADTAKPLLTKWINEDYEAAGEWINKQPAGDFRNEAAANYARMMAKRFPDIAKEWAGTLPEGPEKRKLLEEIK